MPERLPGKAAGDRRQRSLLLPAGSLTVEQVR
jgi:hypothetical protein